MLSSTCLVYFLPTYNQYFQTEDPNSMSCSLKYPQVDSAREKTRGLFLEPTCTSTDLEVRLKSFLLSLNYIYITKIKSPAMDSKKGISNEVTTDKKRRVPFTSSIIPPVRFISTQSCTAKSNYKTKGCLELLQICCIMPTHKIRFCIQFLTLS